VIIIKHGDDDTKEAAEFRYSSSLRTVHYRRRIPLSLREIISVSRATFT